MTLYSCRHDGDQYRISKFDDDMNVQSSYLCTETECECPAGVRPMCRHREMLPAFIGRPAIGNGWYLDYDRGGWVEFEPVAESNPTSFDGTTYGDAFQPNAAEARLEEQSICNAPLTGSNPVSGSKPKLPAWRRARQ